MFEADNLKSLEFAIIENVQRKDLNPIEEAESYKNLIENFNYDQEKVSNLLVKVDHIFLILLRLLTLPEKIIEMIRNEKIITRTCKNFNRSRKCITLLAEKIVKKKLSVRQTESLVRILKNGNQKNLKALKIPNHYCYRK